VKKRVAVERRAVGPALDRAVGVELVQPDGHQLHDLTGVVLVGLAARRIFLLVAARVQVVAHRRVQRDVLQQRAEVAGDAGHQHVPVLGHHVLRPVGADVVGRHHEDLRQRERHALAQAVARDHELLPDHAVGVDRVVGLAGDPRPAGEGGRRVELFAQPRQVALGAHVGDLCLGRGELRLQQEARRFGVVLRLGVDVGLGGRGGRQCRQRSRPVARAGRTGTAAATTTAATPAGRERRRGGQGRCQRQRRCARCRVCRTGPFVLAHAFPGRPDTARHHFFHHESPLLGAMRHMPFKANAMPGAHRAARTLSAVCQTNAVKKRDFFRLPDTTRGLK
jgi:hypothetical protein